MLNYGNSLFRSEGRRQTKLQLLQGNEGNKINITFLHSGTRQLSAVTKYPVRKYLINLQEVLILDLRCEKFEEHAGMMKNLEKVIFILKSPGKVDRSRIM